MVLEGGKREVATMAWPMVVGMLSFTVMGVMDMLFMGWVGTSAQAGVGLATTLFFLFISFFIGLSGGPQSIVSAADGAKDEQRLKMGGGAGVLLGLGGGLIAALTLYLTYRPLLALVVEDLEVVRNTHAYIQARIWGMPFNMTNFGMLAAIQGVGDTRTRMWVGLAMNLCNLILNSVFIFGLGPFEPMGAAGAGLATACSAVLATVMYGRRYLILFGRPQRPSKEVFLSALALGLPSAFQRLFGVSAFTVVSVLVARMGAASLAASEIVLNIISVSFLPGFGIGESAGVLVGRYLGAGKRPIAARSLASARLLAMAFMGVCGIGFAVFGRELAFLFSRDPEVIAIAADLMRYAAIFQLFDAVATVHLCAMRGAGDNRFSLILTTLTSWVLFVGGTLTFGVWLALGVSGMYLALTLEIFALAVITAFRVRGIATGSIGRMDLLLGQPGASSV